MQTTYKGTKYLNEAWEDSPKALIIYDCSLTI